MMHNIISDDSIFKLLASLDITGNLAIVLVVMMAFNSLCMLLNIRMMIKQAKMDNRQAMHADHFSVHDVNVKNANRFSMEAFKLSAEAKAGKPISNKDVCIFIEAQHVIEMAERDDN